jgi:dephospho-CoA kinase
VSRIVLGGGIGAGKSRVAEFLKGKDVIVISADRIGHAVLEPAGPAFDAVAERWPSAVAEGRIDRSRLAVIVFAAPAELAELEAITHPFIMEDIDRLTAEATGPVILEVPVMLPLDDSWIRVYIDADEDVRIRRAIGRGGDSSDVQRRAAAQADRSQWLEWADEVIVNNGSLDDLRGHVDTVWERSQ